MDTFWISGSAFSTALRRPYVTTAGEGLFPSMYSWYRLSKVLKYSPRVTENANNSCVPYTRASCGTSVPHRQWPQQLFSGSAAGFPEDCLQSWSFQEHVIKGSSMDFGRRVEHYPRAVGFFLVWYILNNDRCQISATRQVLCVVCLVFSLNSQTWTSLFELCTRLLPTEMTRLVAAWRLMCRMGL